MYRTRRLQVTSCGKRQTTRCELGVDRAGFLELIILQWSVRHDARSELQGTWNSHHCTPHYLLEDLILWHQEVEA